MLNSLSNAKALINVKELFNFTSVTNLSMKDRNELTQLGRVYFVYLFIYSGLEFTLTFLTHHVFNYTSMQQGWMFFAIGKLSIPVNWHIVTGSNVCRFVYGPVASWPRT